MKNSDVPNILSISVEFIYLKFIWDEREARKGLYPGLAGQGLKHFLVSLNVAYSIYFCEAVSYYQGSYAALQSIDF